MADPAAAPLDWLYSTQWFGVKLGLENMRRLLDEALAMPAPGVQVLHVAGTNGKGSTCAMAASVATAHGIRTGLFTSPHLVDFRERIRIGDEWISAAQLDHELTHLRALVAGWDPHPTFFELSLAVALRHFKAHACELLVLETGMGGRLDATNAVPANISVLTPIGMDHSEWLGDTLEKIAAEKAGIMKPGVPVLSAPQPPAALAVLERQASRLRCPFSVIDGPLHGYAPGLEGTHQRVNAALAVQALHHLGIPLRVDAVAAGLSKVRWPGRFDRRPDANLILDGAHNADGAAVLTTTWAEAFPGRKATLIFSALNDKDPTAMLGQLRPIADRIIVCPVNSPRTRTCADLADAARAAGFDDTSITTCPDLATALTTAAHTPHTCLLTGSLYLVGEAIALLDGATHRASSQ